MTASEADLRLIRLCPDITVDQIPVREVSVDLLSEVDRWSTGGFDQEAYVQIVCLGQPEAGGTFAHLVATARFSRTTDGAVVGMFQRFFTARAEMGRPAEYVPIDAYLRLLESLLPVRRGESLFLFHKPGDEVKNAYVAWTVTISADPKQKLSYVEETATRLLADLEDVYSHRLVSVDLSRAGEDLARATSGLDLSGTEKRVLRAKGVEVLDPIGRGGVSSVWRVRLGQTIRAMKLLAPDVRFGDHGSLEDRFLKEYVVLTSLRGCGHVPRAYEFGMLFGRPYFLQQYLTWPSLRRWASDTPDPEKRLSAALAIIRAVRCVNRRGVVHRDISPKNILIHPLGIRATLIDFGAASRVEHDITGSDDHLGSLKYAAPETRDNPREGSIVSDEFSTAVVVYELLLGKNIAGNLPPLNQFIPATPDWLATWAERALSFDPASRPGWSGTH